MEPKILKRKKQTRTRRPHTDIVDRRTGKGYTICIKMVQVLSSEQTQLKQKYRGQGFKYRLRWHCGFVTLIDIMTNHGQMWLMQF